MLALLASTAGKSQEDASMAGSSSTATAEFLADGDHVTRMLKELGDSLDKKLPLARVSARCR